MNSVNNENGEELKVVLDNDCMTIYHVEKMAKFAKNCEVCNKYYSYVVKLKGELYRYDKILYFCEDHFIKILNSFKEFDINPKIKFLDGKMQEFMVKDVRCDCGCNVMHKILHLNKVYLVCNSCDKKLLEVDETEDYINNSDWK